MRFTLIDRITSLEPGRRIVAVKNLTLAEEYLADHFPGFPVMPGVLMLEAMVQAGAWLVRVTDDFRQSMVVLKDARRIKYGQLVDPGRQLTIEVEIESRQEHLTELKGKGTLGDKTAVSGRLVLEHYNLGDRDAALAGTDSRVIGRLKELYGVLSAVEGS